MHQDPCTSTASKDLCRDADGFQTHTHFAAIPRIQGDSVRPTATLSSLIELHRVNKRSCLPCSTQLENTTRNESLFFERIMGSLVAKVKCESISLRSGPRGW